MKKRIAVILAALMLVLGLSLVLALPAGAVGVPAIHVRTQPGDSIPGKPISGPPSVITTDEVGNPVSGVSVTVSEIGHGYALGGTLTRTTDGSGIATFNDLVINTVDTDYRLYFTATGDYGSRSSNLFDVLVPTEVWVDDDYCEGCANDGHTWNYDAFDNIQDGIDAVAGSTVHVAAGLYIEDITLEDGVEVLGAGDDVTTIQGTGGGPVVTAIDCGATTELSGFTISAGSASSGGGMYNEDSSPTVSDCTFDNNSAAYGGGMYNDSSSPTVSDCTFSNNEAGEVGGEGGYGAGMYNNASSPTVTGCTFDTNDAANGGGGMYNDISSPTVTDCIFTGNQATTTDVSYSNGGGGMYNYMSSPTVTGCTFDTNDAGIFGGGMYNNFSSPTVTDCTFTLNEASIAYGGGMFNYDHSDPTVTDCTFYGNSAAAYGGGMCNWWSSPEVTNCTLYGNSADLGGGMFNDYHSSPRVTNCTFYGNTATHGDGMYNYDNSSPNVANCILWDGGDEIYNDGSTPTVAYCDVEGGYGGGSNIIDAAPQFVNAAGGNFHLQPSSPCIEAGFSDAVPAGITTDCDGEPRFMDGDGDGTATVDIGADEASNQVWVDDDWTGKSYGDAVNGYIFGVNAFATVHEGIDAVTPGGTVHVHPGTYAENNITIDDSVTVESVSADWSDTRINAAGGNGFQFFSFSGDATISGFTINPADTDGIYIEGTLDGSSVTVSNCLIYECGSSGIFGGDGLDGDLFVDDCIIGENGVVAGIHLATIDGTVEITDSFIGAYWDGATICWGNAGDGIELDSIYENGSVLIDNNKIVDNGGDGIADGISGCYGELAITNNIIGAYDYDLTSGDGYFDGNGSNGIYIDYVDATGVVNIEGNKIAQNSDYGIYFLSDSIFGEATIDNNYVGAWTDYATVGDTVYSRSFAGNDDGGIYIGNVTADGSLTIINNKIADNDGVGLRINSTSGDTLILANDVGSWTQDIPGGSVNYDGNAGAGIFVMQVSDGRLLIQGNTVEANIGSLLTGIHIEQAATTADVTVNLNNIVDNDGDGLKYAYGGASPINNLDAENNWWGDDSGPGGAGTGSGDEVSTHVDYDPWLDVSVEGAKAGTITNGTLDNVAGAEVIVTGSATVTTAGYSGNPGSGFSGDIGKYIDVFIDDDAGVTEIEIRLYYTNVDIAGMDEASLSLRWWNGTDWVGCTDSGVNTTDIPGPPAYSGYIWAKIRVDTTPSLADLTGSIFGGGGLISFAGDIIPPLVSNVSLCSEGVTDTTADICWKTNEPSTSQVSYWASPVKMSPIDYTLVTAHHVKLTDLTPGTTYHYRVISKDRTGNVATSGLYSFTTLEAPPPAAIFDSSNLTISPAEVAIGETVTISVLVTNSGDAAGSYELTLKINGVAEETEEVTLEAGVSQSVGFTVSRGEAGGYSVAVDGLSGSFSVTAPAGEEPEDGVAEAPETIEEGSTNWPLWGGVIAAVLIVLIILVAVRRRAS